MGGPNPHLVALYVVTGKLRYREHNPGDPFIAELDPEVEARALAAGAIRVIDRTPTRIEPGSWTLPKERSSER